MSTSVFKKSEKLILNLHENTKDLKIQRSLTKEKRTGRIKLPDLRLYYEATVIKQYGTCIKMEI